MPNYVFTEEEARQANAVWGCNCGPTALAFALQITLEQVRPLIPGFDQKRYTNPSMMRHAINSAGYRLSNVIPMPYVPGRPNSYERLFCTTMALVRVQWCGPWTEPNANPRWAYRQTHWVATWEERGVPFVFDCNGGIVTAEQWETSIIPLILKSCIPNANGEWFPTHIWRLNRKAVQ